MANNYNPYLPYYNFQNAPMQTQNNGINWVQGIEGAKAWQLPPTLEGKEIHGV